MMELNLKEETLKLSLKGLKCEMRFATHVEAIEYVEAIKGTKDFKKQTEVGKKYLIDHGMTEEFYNVLTSKQLYEVIRTVNGEEKN